MESAAQIRPGFVALALRRRWRLLTAAALLGLVAGFAASMALPVSYSSQASLYLNPATGNPYAPDIGTARSDQLVALQTEGTLVATPEVAALAQSRSAVALPDAAERQVRVSAPSNSQVLLVRFSAGRPEVATAGAQAFAEAYLDYRRQRAEQANLAQADQLQEQLDATTTVIEETATALSTTPVGSSEELLLRQQLQVYSSQLAQLNLQLTELRGAVPSTGEVISPATQSTKPSGPPAWAIAAVGLLGVLGVALLYVLAREHSDDRVHDAQDLSGLGAGHPLATVPTGPAAIDLGSGSPEGYRLLLTVIMGRVAGRTPVVCLLGSEGSGASTAVAAGLAAAVHRLGRRVLIVGTDVDQLWDGSRVVSTDRVIEAAPPATAPTVLRLGRDAASMDAVAMSTALPEAVVRARTEFDLVILAGRSGSSAAGWRFAALADRTLVVGELDKDNFTELLDLVETLQQSGVEDIGVVASTKPRDDRGRASRAASPARPAHRSTPTPDVDRALDPPPSPENTAIGPRRARSSPMTRTERSHGKKAPADPPQDRLTDRRTGK